MTALGSAAFLDRPVPQAHTIHERDASRNRGRLVPRVCRPLRGVRRCSHVPESILNRSTWPSSQRTHGSVCGVQSAKAFVGVVGSGFVHGKFVLHAEWGGGYLGLDWTDWDWTGLYYLLAFPGRHDPCAWVVLCRRARLRSSLGAAHHGQVRLLLHIVTKYLCAKLHVHS